MEIDPMIAVIFFFGFKRNLAEPVEKDDFWRHVEYTRNWIGLRLSGYFYVTSNHESVGRCYLKKYHLVWDF